MNEVAYFLNAMEVPKKPRKVKAKPAATRHDYKKRYSDARRIMFKREYPSSYESGYYDKKIVIDTTNGFQNYIQDVFNNLGHFCERVNTGGVPVRDKKTGQMSFRYSGSTKGSSDLHAVLIGGRAWKIEIKKGTDTLRPAQEKYQSKQIAVGAFHSVIYVGDTDMFWDEFDKNTAK